MGERLTKEVRLELKAVQGDVTAFDLVSNRLHMIEAQIKRIKALSTEPIALKITANMPYIPGVSPTGGGFGTGGLGGGVGMTHPLTPPPPPNLPPASSEKGFDISSARQASIVIKELADGTTQYVRTLRDAYGNTQVFDSKTKQLTTTMRQTAGQASMAGAVKNISKALDDTARSSEKAERALASFTKRVDAQAYRQDQSRLRAIAKERADLQRQLDARVDAQIASEKRVAHAGTIRGAVAVDAAVAGEVKNIGASFDSFGASVSRSIVQNKEMNRVIDQNKMSLQALAGQGFVSVERSMQITAKGATVLTERLTHADGRIATLNHSTGQLSMQMEKSAKDTRALGDSIGHTVSKVLLWAISTGIIYGSLRAIMSLKDEMIKVDYQSGRLQRVFAGTASELEKLKGQSIELGAALGIVPSQAIETAVSIARLQKDRTQTLEILRVALLSQNVAELTVEESIKFTTAAILQFNLSAFQAIRVLDQWNQLSNTNRVLTRDLGDSVAIAGRAFFEAGTNIETLNAYTTALTQTMGQSGNQIGTALRTIAVYAQSVSRAGKASQIAGFEIYDAATNSVMPLGEIVSRLAVAFDTLTDAERNSIAEAIAGVRRRTQLLVLLQQYPDVLKGQIQQYQATNSAIREQEVVSRTLQFQIQRLGAEFKQLGVNAGEGGVLSVLKVLVTTGRLFVGSLGANNAVAQLLAATMAALAARFIINQAIYVASRKEISSLSAGITILVGRFHALAAAEGRAAAAAAVFGGIITGVLKLAVFMAAIYAVTKGLDYLTDKLAGFDTPTALEDRLQAIQTALNKTATLKAAERNVKDVIAALDDLNTIEAGGGGLTANQEAIRKYAIEYIQLVTGGVYAHEQLIKMLKTEAGQQEIVNNLKERGGKSERDAGRLATMLVAQQKDKIRELIDEQNKYQARLQRMQGIARLTPGKAEAAGFPIDPDAAQRQIGIIEDKLHTLDEQLKTTRDSIAQIQNEVAPAKLKSFGDAAEESAESLKELESEFKKVIDAQERLSVRKGKIAELYAVDDIEKAQVRLRVLEDYTAELEKQRGELDKIKAAAAEARRSDTKPLVPFTAEDEIRLKVINAELLRLKERRDEALVDVDVASRSKQITDAAEKMKDALDFKIEVSGVLSEDALERAASKYAIITRELERINRQLADAEKNGRTMEEVTALRIRSAELEKDQLRAAKDLQLERLRTEIDIAREMERQVMSAEQSYLFADRETQAKARALAGELEARGGERLEAEHFAALPPDIKRIIKDMIPGLLPVEALSEQMRTAMGGPSAQLSYEQLLGLSPASRREAAEYFPGMMPGQEKGRYELKGPVTVSATEIKVGDLRIPLTPNKFVIPDIPVPATKFILPEKIDLSGAIIMPTSASGAKTGVPATQSAAQPVLNIPEDLDARLGTVFDSFITKQEGVAKELARIFSEQKQRAIELDVDINFAGVQGPLTNLVTRFSHIVEQRLNEKVDALAVKLSSAAQPKRPNVNAEVY